MRFEDLKIHNFRGIRRFEVHHLKDSVVLSGPNGCGKSCVLDAVRLLKSLYGGYAANELQQWFGEFQINLRNVNDIKNLFRDPTDSIRVAATIHLAEEEVNLWVPNTHPRR